MKKLCALVTVLLAHALAMHATEQSLETDDTGDVAAYEKYKQSYDRVQELLKSYESFKKLLIKERKANADKISREKLQNLVDIREELIAAAKDCIDNAEEVYKRDAARIEPYNKIVNKDKLKYLKGYDRLEDERRRCEKLKNDMAQEAQQAAKNYNEKNKRLNYERTRYEMLAQYTTNAVIGIAAIGIVGLGAYFAHDALQKSNLSLNDLSTMATIGLNDFYTQCTRTLQQNWLFKNSASFFVVDTEK